MQKRGRVSRTRRFPKPARGIFVPGRRAAPRKKRKASSFEPALLFLNLRSFQRAGFWSLARKIPRSSTAPKKKGGPLRTRPSVSQQREGFSFLARSVARSVGKYVSTRDAARDEKNRA
jgi:hypothetical protein